MSLLNEESVGRGICLLNPEMVALDNPCPGIAPVGNEGDDVIGDAVEFFPCLRQVNGRFHVLQDMGGEGDAKLPVGEGQGADIRGYESGRTGTGAGVDVHSGVPWPVGSQAQ